MSGIVDESSTQRPIADLRVVGTNLMYGAGRQGPGLVRPVVVCAVPERRRAALPCRCSPGRPVAFFLIGAVAPYAVEGTVRRVGGKRVVMGGLLLMALSVAALARVPNVRLLFAAYNSMAFG
jgi:hypothetical protein